METVISTKWGIDLWVRGQVQAEHYPDGTHHYAEDVEVQNPVAKTWHPITQRAVHEQAEAALIKQHRA